MPVMKVGKRVDHVPRLRSLYLCQVRGSFHHARAPQRPDEEAQGQVLSMKYCTSGIRRILSTCTS